LREAGAEVMIADAYRNELPGDSAGLIREVFTSEVVRPQAIMFTSSSTARNIRTLLDAAGIKLGAGTVLASIGPITSATMRELGMEPTVEAKESTIPGLVQAVEKWHWE
jgi:uroporphyrinogen-III synthase